MKLFDTHAHFDPFVADGTVDAVLGRAAAAGVDRICAVGSSAASNELVVRLAAERPDLLVAAVGYDRDQIGNPCDMDALAALAAAPGVVAVGEIGLDYYYSAETAPQQRALFAQILAFALERRRPVIVHSRYADADTLAMLGEFSTAWKIRHLPDHSVENPVPDPHGLAPWVNQVGGGAMATPSTCSPTAQGGGGPIHPPGVLHCFTGDAAFAENLLALGFLISFSGIVSFNNAEPLREVARGIPADRLLIETDCPYLTPKPFRGKVNEPAYVARVAEVLAEARGTAPEALAEATFANAQRLFQLEG